MATYARAECPMCHQILGKDQMHEVECKVARARSGSSFTFRPNSRTRNGGMAWSWNTGRSYYTYQKLWLCDTCYEKRRHRQATRRSFSLLAIIIIGGVLYSAYSSLPTHSPVDTTQTQEVINSAQSLPSSTSSPMIDKSESVAPPTDNQMLPTAVPELGENASVPITPTDSVDQSLVVSALTLPINGANSMESNGVKSVRELSTPALQSTRELDVAPSIEARGMPKYPVNAIRLHEQGEVILGVSVDASGDVHNVVVEKSSRYRDLDTAAVSSVYSWRFNPARRGGQRANGVVRVPVIFSLSDTQ